MLTCFLCEKTGIIVKKFTGQKLEKCRKIQAFRRKKNLIYKDVVLPRSLQQRGYHLQCFEKFMVLKSIHRKEFDSMFSHNKEPLINKVPPLKIDSSSANNIPSTSEVFEIDSCDIDLTEPVTSYMKYQMDEPSYVNPDISRGVILKSILTRKSPIKKDMTKDSLAFNSGMDFMRYGNVFNQSNLNFAEEELGPKIVEPVSLATVCLFCEKEKRKVGSQIELTEMMSKMDYKKILAFAKDTKDEKFIKKLNTNKMFSFHPLCKLEYRNKYEKITKNNSSDEDRIVFKNLQTKAFAALCAFIDDRIIDKNKTYLLSDLFERYKALLCEIQNTSIPLDVESYNVQNLQDAILNRYEDIKITTSRFQKSKVVHKNGVTDFDSAFTENVDFKNDKIAFELRNEIKAMKRSVGSDNEIIPEKLLRFVGSLIQGPDVTYENNVKIKTVCKNIIAEINIDD